MLLLSKRSRIRITDWIASIHLDYVFRGYLWKGFPYFLKDFPSRDFAAGIRYGFQRCDLKRIESFVSVQLSLVFVDHFNHYLLKTILARDL